MLEATVTEIFTTDKTRGTALFQITNMEIGESFRIFSKNDPNSSELIFERTGENSFTLEILKTIPNENS